MDGSMTQRLFTVLFPTLFAACATAPRGAGPAGKHEPPAPRLAAADVVFCGENHESAEDHARHQALLRQLHAARPDIVISMEMFERDVQPVLDQYLRGAIDEDEFLARSRPWPNYRRDYRPVIEFARSHNLEVIAANVPRELAARAARCGVAAVAGSPWAARTTSAPKDRYWRKFQRAMGGHHGTVDPAAMERYYAAQCLKDDTMAESIADRLAALHARGRRPLVVHFCGHFHSDDRLGSVARLAARAPGLRIEVL